MKINKWYAVVIIIVSLFSCGTPKKQISSYYTYQTECVQNLDNGLQRLRVWGTGVNKKEAFLNAKKQALRDVLFKGISKGKGGCYLSPVILDMAQQRRESAYIRYLFEGNKYERYLNVVGQEYVSDSNDANNKRVELLVDVFVEKLKQELRTEVIK